MYNISLQSGTPPRNIAQRTYGGEFLFHLLWLCVCERRGTFTQDWSRDVAHSNHATKRG